MSAIEQIHLWSFNKIMIIIRYFYFRMVIYFNNSPIIFTIHINLLDPLISMNIIKQFIQQPFQRSQQQTSTNKQIQASNQQVSCDFPTIPIQQKQRFNFTMFNEVSSVSQEQINNNKDDILNQRLSKREKMLQKKEQKIKSQKNIQNSKKNDYNNKNNLGLSASHKRYNLFTEVLSSVGDRESNLQFQSPSLSIDNPNKDAMSFDKKNGEQLANKKRLSTQILYETQKKKKNQLKSSINSLVSRNKALQDSLSEISKGKNGKSYKIIDLGKIDIPKNQEQLYSSMLLNYSKDFTIKMEKFEVNTRKQKHQPLAFINKKLESNLISKFYWGKRQRQIIVSAPQTGLPPLPPKNKYKKQK